MGNHSSELTLNKKTQERKKRLPVNSQRFHYKSPNKSYQIKNIVIHEANEKILAIYQSGTGVQFARYADEFLQEVERKGRLTQRFIKID